MTIDPYQGFREHVVDERFQPWIPKSAAQDACHRHLNALQEFLQGGPVTRLGGNEEGLHRCGLGHCAFRGSFQ